MLPLDGIRVLDFTRHLPGPYATDLLRRLGAEIIKAEPPDGDPSRWLPPYIQGEGALFVLVNSGKRSVVVDLKTGEGRAFVHRLAAACDVAVESYKPGVAKELGIDAATLTGINPRLVYCSMSGYGWTSARSAHDLNFAALSGLLDLQRDADGRPVLPATQIGDMGGALFAALSILGALIERNRTGAGKEIDISLAASIRAMMPTAEALYRGTHHTPETFPLTGALPSYDVYRTSDGKYLAVASLEPHFWEAFCEAIGHPELIPRQLDDETREETRAAIAAAIVARSRAEWEETFSRIDACVEPVLTIEEAHSRFGDPMASHPLQTNFAAPPGAAEALGESLVATGEIAGLAPDELARVKASPAFRPGGRLKRMLLRAQQSLIRPR